jgi:hypothetical protein
LDTFSLFSQVFVNIGIESGAVPKWILAETNLKLLGLWHLLFFLRPSCSPRVRLSFFMNASIPVYLSICLSVYLSICLTLYLSTCLPVYLSACLPLYLSASLPVYLSVHCNLSPGFLSICLRAFCRYVCLFTCLPFYQSTFLQFHLSACNHVYLSIIYLSTCLSVSLSCSLPVYMSVCLPTCLFFPVYLSICLFLDVLLLCLLKVSAVSFDSFILLPGDVCVFY